MMNVSHYNNCSVIATANRAMSKTAVRRCIENIVCGLSLLSPGRNKLVGKFGEVKFKQIAIFQLLVKFFFYFPL